MPEIAARQRVRQFALALVLLIPGTPQVLAQDYAIDSLIAFARRAVNDDRAADAADRSGAPPDDERALQQSPPTPSGAQPPYPLNHTFDGELVDVSDPPANHDFSAEPYTVGTPPTNHDFETVSNAVGTPPTNHDFETGDLTGWTPGGTVTIQSDATHGSWAKLSGSSATLISDAFTVDAAAQTFAVELGLLTTSGLSWVKVYVLSGAGYTTQTEVGDVRCTACGL